MTGNGKPQYEGEILPGSPLFNEIINDEDIQNI